MSVAQLEQTLREFDRVGTIVRADPRRQVWRFGFSDREYFLIFYPRVGAVRRLTRAGSALLEFVHLQGLGKASIPSPRAVAHLAGFRIKGIRGDALVVEAIANAQQLDRYLMEHELRGLPVPQWRRIVEQVIDIVLELGKAKFASREMGLHSFLIADGKVYLHDVCALHGGGMRLKDVFALGHRAARFATRTDLLRGWLTLNPDAPIPLNNPMSATLRRRRLAECQGENANFGRLKAGRWSGVFTRTSRCARPWSLASRIDVTQPDWQTAWPTLLAQIESDQLTSIKRDPSGEVLEGQVILGGKPIPVIVKRPRRRVLYRYLIDLFRPARAQRMWLKAWSLITLNLPCEWPMLLMERKFLGYTLDAIIVFERVPGESLDQIDLDTLEPRRREMLFRRAGRSLRAIERNRLVHYDSKSTNWIVYQDDAHGAIPVIIDTDGIRPLNFWLNGWSIHRLLRAMKRHGQYSPEDSRALCQGFAPFGGKYKEEDALGGKP